MLFLNKNSIGAISVIGSMVAIEEHLKFFQVVPDLLLFKHILCLMALGLVTKNSLHILLSSQLTNQHVVEIGHL
eukprot:142031-Ditylum_brightwellii.AAC.2